MDGKTIARSGMVTKRAYIGHPEDEVKSDQDTLFSLANILLAQLLEAGEKSERICNRLTYGKPDCESNAIVKDVPNLIEILKRWRQFNS